MSFSGKCWVYCGPRAVVRSPIQWGSHLLFTYKCKDLRWTCHNLTLNYFRVSSPCQTQWLYPWTSQHQTQRSTSGCPSSLCFRLCNGAQLQRIIIWFYNIASRKQRRLNTCATCLNRMLHGMCTALLQAMFSIWHFLRPYNTHNQLCLVNGPTHTYPMMLLREK